MNDYSNLNIIEGKGRADRIQSLVNELSQLDCHIIYGDDILLDDAILLSPIIFTPFLFDRFACNAHSGAFSSAKSNGSMRIFNAQRCQTQNHIVYKFMDLLLYIPIPINELFINKFRFYLDGDRLEYDNLIHLLIMVKNGGPQFENMLLKNKHLIDRWTILDTGSTDDTIAIINRSLADKNGEVFQEPFINFRDSRNRLLELSKSETTSLIKSEATGETKISESCVFTLMLDDTYIVEGDLRKFLTDVRGDTKADSFSLFIKSDDVVYCSNRILKVERNLKYTYKIHEVVQEHDNYNVIVPLEKVFIDDKRFDYMEERTMARKALDLKLLFEELSDDPRNPRTYYYLGQTYNLMKEYEKAFRWFQLRGEMEEGFIQERIDALFEAARTANFKLGLDWSVCESLYLKAHRLDESRPDSLYFLGIHYLLENKERNKAFHYLKQAFLVGYPIHTQYSLKPTLTYHFVPKFLAQLCYEFGDFSLGLQTTTLFLQNNKEPDEIMISWHNIFLKLENNPMFVKKPKFVFVADGGFGQWTGRDILTTGMGGSETFVVEMARHIQASGKFNVVVYCNCQEPSYFEHVEYLPIAEFNRNVDMDVCMVSRYSEFLPVAFHSNAKQVFFIAHDLTPSGVVIPLDQKLTKVFCLTEWHKEYFINIFPQLRERVESFSYGMDPFLFPIVNKKSKNRFIYSSFPNRGLLPLLQVWPDIVARFPDASLHIYSDVDGQWANQVEPEMMNHIRALLKGTPNIVYVGWINKQALYNAWALAEYWYYPCTFKETFCLTAFEAAASKTVCITNGLAGLQNTVGDRGFIANTLDDLFSIMDPTRENERTAKVEANYEYVCKMSWASRAEELLDAII